MITYKTGNIFNESVDAIVNTVNCVGVMGRGIALQFKKSYPANFKAYEAACKRKEIKPGKIFVYDTESAVNPRFIINFPTKQHWREKSRMQYIKAGLRALVKEVQDRNIKSIAIPPLGSGLGGLNWVEVRQHIENVLSGLKDLKVIVFEPQENIGMANRIIKSHAQPKMTSGRAALIILIDHYLNGLMDPFVTLLEIHKLMYFMQEAGEPLRLQFKKAHYGPYAENLRHVLNDIEGHLISGYNDGGDKPDKNLNLLPGALESAKKFLDSKPTLGTKNHLDKVSGLVDGFETPFGLELLSTVHWIAKKEQTQSIETIIKKVYAWNHKKMQFTQRQIKIAHDILQQKHWIV